MAELQLLSCFLEHVQRAAEVQVRPVGWSQRCLVRLLLHAFCWDSNDTTCVNCVMRNAVSLHCFNQVAYCRFPVVAAVFE